MLFCWCLSDCYCFHVLLECTEIQLLLESVLHFCKLPEGLRNKVSLYVLSLYVSTLWLLIVLYFCSFTWSSFVQPWMWTHKHLLPLGPRIQMWGIVHSVKSTLMVVDGILMKGNMHWCVSHAWNSFGEITANSKSSWTFIWGMWISQRCCSRNCIGSSKVGTVIANNELLFTLYS